MIRPEEVRAGKILIVDDLQANVRLLERALAAAGYTNVSSTMNPQTVVGLHRANAYDLILLDLLMPGMDGFQIIEQLKALESASYLPIIVVTARPDHKLRALRAGARDFVSKPFDLVELETRIYNTVEGRLLYRRLEKANVELERIVAERTSALRLSEERFRRLTELSSDWYWEQDANGEFTQLSGPALEMLGLRDPSPSTRSIGELRQGQDGRERAALDEHIAARRPFLDLIYIRTGVDGTRHYFQVSGEPIFDLTGCYSGYRGIAMDVTPMVQRGSPETSQ